MINQDYKLNVTRVTYWVLSFYLIFLLFLPRISVVLPIELNLRFEDLLMPLLFIAFIYITIQKRIYKNIVMVFSFFIYSYMFFITIFFISFSDLDVRAFIIFGKIFQYFMLFVLMYYILNFDKYFFKIEKLIYYLFLANILYGLYQVLTGYISYYGIRIISEPSPFLSGSVFFHCMVFMFFLYSKYHHKKYLFLTFLSFLMIALTVSRTNTISGLIFLIILFLFTTNVKRIIYFIFIAIIFFLLYWVLSDVSANFSRLSRFQGVYEALLFRYELWSIKLSTFFTSPYQIILGLGIGETNMYVFPREWRGFENVVDNQYVRFIIEIGIIGTLLWLVSIFITLFKTKDKNNIKILFAYILTMLIAGIGAEIFFLSKPGALFYIFLALLICSPSAAATRDITTVHEKEK